MTNNRGTKPIILGASLVMGLAALVVLWGTPARPRIPDRDNIRWQTALEIHPGRYGNLDVSTTEKVRAIEARYRDLLDALTAVDGEGGDHGRHHILKPDLERELWNLLQRLPKYPAAPRLILAAIDDVYLGYHGNGWWGDRWHWPYLDARKAAMLADRLSLEYPEYQEEVLWTKVYCARIDGVPAGASQAPLEPGISSSDPVRVACTELLKRFPEGKYSSRAAQLRNEKNPALILPHMPIRGRTRPSGGYAMTLVRYEGPEFIIDRSQR